MDSESKQKALSWGISAVLHVILFAAAALAGLFVRVQPAPERPIDVALYEEAPSAGGSSGGGGTAEAAPAPPAADEIALVKDVPAPDISESYTKQPERQRAYREQQEERHRRKVAPKAHAAMDGDGAAPAGKAHHGKGGNSAGTEGTGKGADASGEGNGTGTGQGSGTGSQAGDGRDAAAARRPATPPQLIAAAPPDYPEELRQQGVEGAVRVRVIVGSDGSVASAAVAASSGYGSMDAAAVAAAYRYRFFPARNAYGEPVRCAVSQTVRFHLD